MNNNFDIELQDDTIKQKSNIQLPLNFLTIGEIKKDDLKIYIKQDVYKKLEELASSDTSKELGSILIGDYCEELDNTHIIISDYIEAKYTDASASTLTFTHETWDYVHKEHDKKYPDKRIIGWQHTHPNYGIFLSNYDMFIQDNFFNLPFQIAYVIDPIQNIRGFFQWKKDSVEKVNGFYIYDEVGKVIKIEQTKNDDKRTKEKYKTPLATKILLIILSLATISALGLSYSSIKNYKYFLELQKVIQEDINTNSEAIIHLQEQLTATTANSTEQPKIQVEESEKAEFKCYTVQSGDTLYDICTKHNIDYEQNLRIILGVNGIKNPNNIYIGQNLLLPIVH